jgi:hypothetical protein
MKTFLVVAFELVEYFFSWFKPSSKTKHDSRVKAVSTAMVATSQKSALSNPTIISISKPALEITNQHESLAVAVPKSKLMLRPLLMFDGVMRELSYGSTVRFISHEGRFTKVDFQGQVGFIFKEELLPLSALLPSFEFAKFYDYDNPEVIKVRQYLCDEFFTQELYLPLQSVELVSQRLIEAGRVLNWPILRPRLPGLWHSLWRGQPRVEITVFPRTGCVMEYYQPDGEGRLAYVLSVQPDETVEIEGVGFREEGVYTKETLTKDAWQALKPVWIYFN